MGKRDKGIALYKRAKQLIPGGTQLLSKRPEMFLPEEWPSYYEKCKGVSVWDLDGNHYTDMTISGIGACSLGYADDEVDSAVLAAVRAGNMCTLNAPEEVELAELMIEMHPWADMVRYARTGGEAMAVAVRIARASRQKDKVLFCGYHGWHDWYLSANLASDTILNGHLLPGLDPGGVPRGLLGTCVPFAYNDLKGFEEQIFKSRDELAAVVMEPARNYLPEEGFLSGIRQVTRDLGIPLIFDEVSSGFRMVSGGIHLKLGTEPDIAVFAKALGNGYPMAAVIGRKEVMNAAQRTFISSTYWTDKIGPAAAVATVRKHLKNDVGTHLVRIGGMMQDGWLRLGQKHGLEIIVAGIEPLTNWRINIDEAQLLHTIIVLKMLEKGYLTSKTFYATFAHTNEHVNNYLKALDEVLGELMPAIKAGTLKEVYSGPIAHAGFKRLT
ncbi:MAG: aminotransferase class III-fold pyridoxal phosphate-dependent enzyme [Nitrospirae bacterium]|nr:aminotransferase class III-fold pyridoxal phosphate-dependent enzyme [Nitrospirota bacterium]